jgi:hypothetical protein
MHAAANGRHDSPLVTNREPKSRSRETTFQADVSEGRTISATLAKLAARVESQAIEIGSLKMQFTLSETTQCAFRLREALTWTGLAVLFAIQIGLIYWLIE